MYLTAGHNEEGAAVPSYIHSGPVVEYELAPGTGL
jgi:hypothetical protein